MPRATSFAIVVHGALPDSQAALSALALARAAVADGHQILRVFFYHQAVTIANALRVTPSDEPDDAELWLAFAREHDLELAVCVAAAQRRGIVREAERARYALPASNLRPGFELVGLGQLIDATTQADRTITFPGRS